MTFLIANLVCVVQPVLMVVCVGQLRISVHVSQTTLVPGAISVPLVIMATLNAGLADVTETVPRGATVIL